MYNIVKYEKVMSYLLAEIPVCRLCSNDNILVENVNCLTILCVS